MWLTRLAAALDSWAFAPVCTLCGDPGMQPGFDLCAACESEFPLCDECVWDEHALDLRWSAFDYEFPVAGLVRDLKFAGETSYARVLGLATLRRWMPHVAVAPLDCLLPVPLHLARLRSRGFNQSYEIARPMARALNLPILERTLRRVRATQPQTTLPAAARLHNVAGAFELYGPVHGLRIGVLDDVLTTGATLQEIARVLKCAGAARVVALSVARVS